MQRLLKATRLTRATRQQLHLAQPRQTILAPGLSSLAKVASPRTSQFGQQATKNAARFYSTASTSNSSGGGLEALADFNKTKVTNQMYSEHNGLPLMIAITKGAAERLNEVSRQGDPKCILKVSVESGGCHGFQYILELTEKENIDTEKNSVFTRNGAQVAMDKMSLEILRDSKIDYVHELIGSQFKVVDSPFTKSSCGCGSSFDIDFDKLNEEKQ